MKPARFILNSDYATVRSTGSKELSITVPNSITVPTGTAEYTIGSLSVNVGSSTDSFMVYFTSSLYDYACFGVSGSTKPSGASTTYTGTTQVFFGVTFNGSTATFKVTCGGNVSTPTTWTGYGQTITAHIFTFKDPFTE